MPARAGGTFDAVRQRGEVACGVNIGVAGFSAPDRQGRWSGLDIDLCRAIAAALFGDPSRTRFVPTSSAQRFTALQSGEIDVLTRNATQTLMRDTALGLNMAGVNFFDGQGFMVAKTLGVERVEQLAGATICVMPGTTSEQNMADYFRARHLAFTPVVIENVDELFAVFSSGRCDALSTDASQLAAMRATQAADPSAFVILPERISKEPLGPMVRQGDEEWFNLVKWTLSAMIEAEELGITQENVDRLLDSPSPEIARFLGVKPGFGQALGVDERWAYRIVKSVGNYGESFERNLGKGSPIRLERGLNDLWTRGGLVYSLPMR
jgi:general L-amino acid transport system substrate-binding protein